jgi:hypothetical protein
VFLFSKSSSRLSFNRKTLITLALLTVCSVGTYLLVSALYFRIGFPLDDAWIHQTYARNIATSGEWAFLPGQPSGGSTSPLWTFILSFSYLFHISPLIWTFGIGTLILWCSALLAELTIRQHLDSYHPLFPWVGGIVIFEWHLVWASISGMETLLFSLLVMGVFYLLLKKNPEYMKIGLLIGIGIWLRPDALTLLGPACMVAGLDNLPSPQRIRNIFKIIIGFLALFSLYILFTLALSGTPWPTTFYAKQAEYAPVANSSIFESFGKLSIQLIIGIGILLLPGYVITMRDAIINKKWNILAGFFWLVGMVGLYAWRLPEGYQHGRYLIPSMFVFFSFSLFGMIFFFKDLKNGWRWSLGVSWIISFCVVLFYFWGYGAYIYAKDVAFIESEMVDTANWVADNIPAQNIIAAHDIGALGYFGDHPIVDLAGLITPEVIPFINDESLLKKYMDANKVNYLISFPSWYPQLIKGLPEIYITQGKFAPLMKGENLVVYLWLDSSQKTR